MKLFNSLKISFDARDIWIGLYWTSEPLAFGMKHIMFFICIVPMFPITFSITTKSKW